MNEHFVEMYDYKSKIKLQIKLQIKYCNYKLSVTPARLSPIDLLDYILNSMPTNEKKKHFDTQTQHTRLTKHAKNLDHDQ